MGVDFSSIKYTIELNKDKLIDNKELTNELLVDDIMLALGYNKKRTKGVNRLFDSKDADWEVIIDGEKRLFVKVIGYKAKEIRVPEIYTEYTKEFNFGIVTDGEILEIYNLEIDKEYPIFEFNILDNDKVMDEVFINLYNESYSSDNINDIYKESLLNRGKVIDILKQASLELVDIVLATGGYKNTEENKQIVHDSLIGIEESEVNKSDYIKIDDYNEIVLSYETMIETLSGKIDNHLKTIEELKNIKPIYSGDNEAEYREQIEKLSHENVLLKEEISKLNKELVSKLNNNSDNIKLKEKQSEDLLSSIIDNKDARRSYVGVVNNKLFQNETLPRFVGMALEELYNLVKFDLMPELFAGGVFKLIQKPIRKDILIDKSIYDIDLTGLDELEVIAKLIGIFNKFEGVVFKCKMVGKDVIIEETKDEVIDNNLKLIGVTVDRLNEVAWATEKGISLLDIEYIGNDEEIYEVAKGKGKVYNKKIINTIDILYTINGNREQDLNKLNTTDLTRISKCIEVLNRENCKHPRILQTNYVITSIDTIDKLIPIIKGIVTLFEMDSKAIKIYFRAEVKEGSVPRSFIVDEGDFELAESSL